MPLNPSEPPHFRPMVSAESGAEVRVTLLALHESIKGRIECADHERGFASGFLLIEDQHRLGHFWIACTQLVEQHAGLCILAAKAEHRSSGDVGMMNVAGQQAAEGLRILTRSTAAALVSKKADAVDVGEDAVGADMR
jgi:hypothetical protein